MPDGNGRDLGIAGWENMGMGFKFQMGMGMKSLKWEGFVTKNLFPHISNTYSKSVTGKYGLPGIFDYGVLGLAEAKAKPQGQGQCQTSLRPNRVQYAY